jgi:hypothetical protein
MPIASYQETIRTGSKESLDLARTWLNDCKQSHADCQLNRISDWVPTRLIDLGCESEVVPKIVEFRNCRSDIEYCTLSHCWGGADIFRLLISNLSELKFGLQIAYLPRTFREAIFVAKTLGYRFLWIDCLCIIQDSLEDWKYEAGRMV